MIDPPPPDVTGALLKGASDALKSTVDTPNGRAIISNLSEPFVDLSRIVRNWSLPLKLRAAKKEKFFEEEFASLMVERVERIPEDQRVPPKERIATPILQGISESFDEESIRDMYMNLLAAAADGRRQNLVHPAYPDIVRQLAVDEVEILNQILKYRSAIQPIARVRRGKKNESAGVTVIDHLLGLNRDGVPAEITGVESAVDNWIRLGLIAVDYSAHLVREDAYEWVNDRPEYKRAEAATLPEEEELKVTKGMLGVTAFGQAFAEAVLPAAT